MESLLFYLLRASLITILFYIFYKLILSRNTYHSASRQVLIYIMASIILLPFLRFSLLPDAITAIGTDIVNDGQAGLINVTEVSAGIIIEWSKVFISLYVLGLLFFLIKYFIGIGQLYSIIHKSDKQPYKSCSVLCVTRKTTQPFSWWKYIVISKDENTHENQPIMEHEYAHVKLRHSVDRLLSDLFVCFFWFNPFAWLLRSELQSVHEYQADEQVLNNGFEAKKYQILLISKSVGETKFAQVNNFQQRCLHKRISMMKKNKTKFKTKLIYAAGVPVLLIAFSLLSLPQLNAADPVKETSSLLSYPVKDTIPTYKVNGKKITKEEMEKINPEDIESVNVYKNETAIETYGEDGKNGVVEITLKRSRVYILDGKKVSKEQAEQVDVKNIKSVDVIKNTKENVDKIEIVTKK